MPEDGASSGALRLAQAQRAEPVAHAPNREAMARAVQAFLDAAGLKRGDPELARTAQRVADAWAEDFIAGYAETPAAALGPGLPAEPGASAVTVRDIDFVSVCPHHLLPYRGVAHICYLPGAQIVGFSRLVKLVDCLARRLVLQETMTRQIAEALTDQLGARGVACVTVAEQTCMTMRGVRRSASRTECRAYTGAFEHDPSLRGQVGLP